MAVTTNHFYHATTRKYIALFGTMFNKMSIVRKEDSTGAEVQRMIVPISYGPQQKFLAMLDQDPRKEQKSQITLPRMSFEITDFVYDPARKIGATNRLVQATIEDKSAYKYWWAPAPYNLEFQLSIMTKYSEDGVQLFEQIIPFFKPEITVSALLLDGIEPFDIPIILNSVSVDEGYEGNFEERKVIVWTLNFTMKAWYFGETKDAKRIKFMDLRFVPSLDSEDAEANGYFDLVTHQPGLDANGNPTTDIDVTIDWSDINIGDDWAVITQFGTQDDS